MSPPPPSSTTDDSNPYREATFSVLELGTALTLALEQLFPNDVWVQGEIRGLKRGRNDHVYFDLVEPSETPGGLPKATLPVALFKQNKDIVNRMLTRAGGGMRMEDGMRVRIRSVVSFYAPTGRLQLRMTSIDPTFTLSQLASDRDHIMRVLSAEGLLACNKALAMPVAPLRVGLVTAAGSAAYHDVVHELEVSGIGWHIHHVDAQVQGQRAEAALCAALSTLAARHVDVIVLVRGGGSRTDLAVFDSEALARCIATLSVPVLTGIGHEVDRSIADEVAYESFKTPTAVAAALNARVAAFLAQAEQCWFEITEQAAALTEHADEEVIEMARRVARATRTVLDAQHTHVTHLGQRIRRETGFALAHTSRRVDQHATLVGSASRRQLRDSARSIDAVALRVAALAPRHVANGERTLAAVEARVRGLDPARVLARGWSITRDADGRTVRSVATLRPDDELHTTFADGVATSRLVRTHPLAAAPGNAPEPTNAGPSDG
jgi:exodeoxyribonuclease VII large subunit